MSVVERRFRRASAEHVVRLVPEGDTLRAEVDGRVHRVRVLRREPRLIELEMDGTRRILHLAVEGERRHVARGAAAFVLVPVDPASRRRIPRDSEQGLEAEMPGLVRSIRVTEGEEVAQGQTLVVLEAMKMEIRIAAPGPARVRRIRSREGDRVNRGQVLVDLIPL
jgi:acetyl/propionyl-CoA carboxylase alpha subunit